MLGRRFVVSLLTCFLLSACTFKPSLSKGKHFYQQRAYLKAYKHLHPLADQGDKEAQYAIGYMYYYGMGVSRNPNLAQLYLSRSANANYAPAVEALHRLHLKEQNNKPSYYKNQ